MNKCVVSAHTGQQNHPLGLLLILPMCHQSPLWKKEKKKKGKKKKHGTNSVL